MKKLFFSLIAILLALPVSAICPLIEPLSTKINDGDLYPIWILGKEVKKAVANNDKSVLSDMDIALYYYYEAVMNQFLMEHPDENETNGKIAHASAMLGDDHYMTLSMKALYGSALNPSTIDKTNKALAAIEEELGKESWQHAAMTYWLSEVIANNGKIQEALDIATKGQQFLSGTSMKDHWINGCLHIMQPVLMSNLQKFDDLSGYHACGDIIVKHTNAINADKLPGTANSTIAHLANYLSSVARAHGLHKQSIEISEKYLQDLELMEMDKTGLANELRGNIAICYYKDKNFKKARPILQQYLKVLKDKGLEDSPSYKYMENAYKQMPKK